MKKLLLTKGGQNIAYFAYLSTGTLPVGMEPGISVGANTGWSGSPISTDVGEATGQSLALNGSHHGRIHRDRHGAYKYIVMNWSNPGTF